MLCCQGQGRQTKTGEAAKSDRPLSVPCRSPPRSSQSSSRSSLSQSSLSEALQAADVRSLITLVLNDDLPFSRRLTPGPCCPSKSSSQPIMRLSSIFGCSLLSLTLPFVASAASHGPLGKRHDSVAHRARSDVHVYEKRSFSNARFTFYDVGL